MASSIAYLDYVLAQLSDVEGVSHRAMMGEYLLYCQGRLFGGIYDDRLLVKPVAAARALMPDAELVAPYDGASEMLLVECIDDRAFLKELVESMYDELPDPKRRRAARASTSRRAE